MKVNELTRDQRVAEFFSTAQERERVRRAKEAGALGPWTEDEALSTWYFCNVFREDDRTTRWFAENVRGPLSEKPADVVAATVAFRWFNRIETGEVLLPELLRGRKFRVEKARDLIAHLHPVVTGAHMVRTPSGFLKGEGVLALIEGVLPFLCKHQWDKVETLQALFHSLKQARGKHGGIGDFLAYEVVTDLNYTKRWWDAPDQWSWAQMGPGARAGASYVHAGGPGAFPLTGPGQRKSLEVAQELLEKSGEYEWDAEWTLREAEHWLCEYWKWVRATYLGQRQKRRYR